MIAQLILTALLFGILIYAWTEYRRSPVIGLGERGAVESSYREFQRDRSRLVGSIMRR